MNVVSKSKLRNFWADHPHSQTPLKAWYKDLSSTDYTDLNHLHTVHPSADYTDPFTIFNIGGNKYRVIVIIDYAGRFVKIRHVFTHAQYDYWNTHGRPA